MDSSEVLVEGPWRHRFVAANGARFHVAEMGEGPLVLLLHGFPQFWWCWRHHLSALAEAGYHAVAMDLRGYGASDKPPRGYDTGTLCADVAGVIRGLGAPRAVVVGHDWGAWVAWAMPAFAPGVTSAIAALSMPHPLEFRTGLGSPAQARAARRVLDFQVPLRPERWLSRGDGVPRLMREWAGPGFEDPEAVVRYQRAMRVPFVAHTSLEYFRWAVRSPPRRDGRRFAAAVDQAVTVPVLHLQGDADPYVLPATARGSVRRVRRGRHDYRELAGAGHFLPEERPDEVANALIGWLPGVTQQVN